MARSLPKKSNTGKNRSNAAVLGTLYSKIGVPNDFPMVGGYYEQTDEPIKALHYHDFLELGYCHEGSGIFMVNDRILRYEKGDAFLISGSPESLHLARSTDGTKSLWTFLYTDHLRLLGTRFFDSTDFLDISLFAHADFPNIIKPQEYPLLNSLIKEIVEEFREKREGYKPLIQSSLMSLLVQSRRQVSLKKANRPGSGLSVLKIRHALEHIANHFDEEISVETLAALCSYSVANFRKLFHKSTGLSPVDYINNFRIQMAVGYLSNTSESILDISLRTGFPSLSNFNRNFKRHMRCSPRDWRKRHSAYT